MRKEISFLQESLSEISRNAALRLKDQINFALEQFTERELIAFFKAAISSLCADLADETQDQMKKELLRQSDFFCDLRIDERLRLLVVIKEVLFETLSALNIYTSPTAKRISELIDDNTLELAYTYEIELMKPETAGETVTDEIADELYKTRKRLEKQKNFITSLLENSPDAIALLDAKRRVTLWNDAAKELIGYRQTQIIGKSLEKLSAEDSDLRSILREAEKKGKVLGSELSIKTQEGKLLPVSVSVSTIDNAGEKEANFVVVMRDASELRKMRDRIIDAEKLSAMAKIAGAVAHEVRNPLNSLILNLDLLDDELGELLGTARPERLITQIDVLREEIEKLNEIVTNYLSLSRLTKIDFKLCSLQEVLDDALSRAKLASEIPSLRHLRRRIHFKRLYHTEADTRTDAEKPELADSDGLEIKSDAATVALQRVALLRTPVYAMLDERQFARVLSNLFQNAMEAIAATEKKRAGEISVDVYAEGATAVVEISDTGEGIAEENMSSLFTPFYSTKSGGTGLGLYIVREIVLSHRGEIEIKSRTDGAGALARITLPLAEKQF